MRIKIDNRNNFKNQLYYWRHKKLDLVKLGLEGSCLNALPRDECKSLSFKGLEVLNDSSIYTTTAYYKNPSPRDLFKTLHETKILWQIIEQCPNCLQKVKEGLQNRPLPRQEN